LINDAALNICWFPLMLDHGRNTSVVLASEDVIFLSCIHVCHLCILEHCEPSSKAVSSFITRSSHSSYVDEDCDSLALCDPMQRMNYEVDSLLSQWLVYPERFQWVWLQTGIWAPEEISEFTWGTGEPWGWCFRHRCKSWNHYSWDLASTEIFHHIWRVSVLSMKDHKSDA
jgi:hypothetical protein